MRQLSIVTSFMLFCIFLHAQEKLTIENVRKTSTRGAGHIIENEQVKGYYIFYESDKVDRKTNEYTLQILDANLNKVKDIKFNDSKKIYLLESSYNGNSLLFMFYDVDQKMIDYRIYKMDGTRSFNYSKILDKRSEAYFKTIIAQQGKEESENQNIFDIKGKGFISSIPLRESRNYTYEINFYASDKRKSWTYNPIETGKVTAATFLGANDSIAIFEVISKEKLMSNASEQTLLGINLANGRKVFEIRPNEGKNQLYPMNFTSLNESGSEYLLIGPYYQSSDNVLKDKSQGLGIWVMNNEGKILRSAYNSWTKDISKFLKINQKGTVEDMGYVFIHNVLQTQDGNFFAVGEGYKKAASGAGIALNVLSGSYSGNVTKLVVTNMLMMQFNEKFEVVSAQIYEKNNNNFNIPGADFATPHTLALIAKAFGAFDYSFTQTSKDKSSFLTGYIDYEKSKGYKGLTFHSISYADGKITTDKINLESKASTLQILPAKPGFILISEYFPKEKKVDLRLERLN